MSLFRTVRIPEDLIKTVERIIEKKKELGYRSHSEFVIDAVRRRVESLKTQQNKLPTNIRLFKS